MKTNLIGISGKIFSGKDTFTQIFQKMSFEKSTITWENKKFAYKLKQFASSLTGIPVEDFESQIVKASELGLEWKLKSVIPVAFGEYSDKMFVRDLLIRIGHGCRQVVHEDIWINALFSERKEHSLINKPKDDSILRSIIDDLSKPNWFITDLRYLNEARRIRKEGGVIIRINSNRAKIVDHPSETELDNFDFDYVVNNSGTIKELTTQINQIGKELEIWT